MTCLVEQIWLGARAEREKSQYHIRSPRESVAYLKNNLSIKIANTKQSLIADLNRILHKLSLFKLRPD